MKRFARSAAYAMATMIVTASAMAADAQDMDAPQPTLPLDPGYGIGHLPPYIARARSKTAPFKYTRSLSADGIRWFSNFETYVAGDPLPKEQVEAFRKAGTRLVLYEWATGFYLENAQARNPEERWEAEIWHRHPEWLLNRDNPGPDHQNPDVLHAYYYDMAHPELRAYRAKVILGNLRESGYDGVFYDCTGFQSVWETPTHPLRTLFQQRHPGVNYNQACVDFYQKIIAGGYFNFLNQCSRFAEHAYPYSDFDLTESLMTRNQVGPEVEVYLEGKGMVKRRETAYLSVDHILSICSDINQNRRKFNPALRPVHLNYGYSFLEPTGKVEEEMRQPIYRLAVDRQAIHYAQACAKLVDHEQYYYVNEEEGHDPIRFHRDPVYFVDLGQPLTDSHELIGEAYVRFFENGFVVVNQTARPMTLSVAERLPKDLYGIWDSFTGRVVTQPETGIEIPHGFYPASSTKTPSGRIFAYVRNTPRADADSPMAHLAFSRLVVDALAKDGLLDATAAHRLGRQYDDLAKLLGHAALADGTDPDREALTAIAKGLEQLVTELAVVPVAHAWQTEGLRALGRTCLALDATIAPRRGVSLADVAIGFESGKASRASSILKGEGEAPGQLRGKFILAANGFSASVDIPEDAGSEGLPSVISAALPPPPGAADEHLLFAFADIGNRQDGTFPLLGYCEARYTPPFAIVIDRGYMPASAGKFSFNIAMTNNTMNSTPGKATLSLPEGWSIDPATVLDLQVDARSDGVIRVKGNIPADHPHGPGLVHVAAELGEAILRQNVEVMVVPRLVARLASSKMVIDGILDEPSWLSAHQTESPFLCHREGKPVFPQTKARILYDEDHIYLAFECDEPDIKALRARITKNDGNVWEDDCVEAYIDTSNRRFGSYHAAFNTLGVSFQDNMPGNIGARPNVGIHKAPGRWTAEIAIPYQALGYMGMPRPGDVWGLNLCREKHVPTEICSAWSCGIGGFGDPRRLGELVFSPPVDRASWKISSSRGETGYALAHAIDGNMETFWTNGASQETGEWIAVDLGESRPLSGLAFDAGIHRNDYPARLSVAVSEDGASWEKVSEIEGNDGLINVRLPGITTRHARIEIVTPNNRSHGWWWTIHDLIVY